MNEFLVNVLNGFLRKDGGRSSTSSLLNEVEADLNVARKECEMLKLKLQQYEESKGL